MGVHLKYAQDWIDRVLNCVKTVKYSFVDDGVVFGDVQLIRGIRHDDLISPYLYILCVEGLISIIRQNEDVGLIHGYTIARGAPTISHLLFADDSYFSFEQQSQKLLL